MKWKKLQLSKIAREDKVIVPPNSTKAETRSYLGLEQVESGTGRILSYNNNSAEGKSTTFAFDNRHVLYGKLRPYLNKVAVPKINGRCSTEIIPLLPVDVDREFLAFLLRTDKIVNAAMADKTGSRMPRTDMKQLLNQEVIIPETLIEQRQIASHLKAQLEEVENARQAAQVQLSDIHLLRTRMLKAFFAELDSVPKKRLGDNAPTTSGSTPSRGNKQYWEPAEIAWVKTGEVAFTPITSTKEAISNLALAECSVKLLPPKSVLIAMIGQGKTRGQSAILEIPATTNQNCFAVMPNDTWEPEFLYLWMKSSYQDLRDLSSDRGGSQSALNGTLLNALEVPAPTKAEQLELVAHIQSAITEIDALEQSTKAKLADIEKLPARILAKSFEN
ncbi:restriction endonuclease subunit S [Marinomonas sp. BSi20584]|uniref:restriction endonuclease subunit S n=1 Tax=Marinomonas sp. BSi20584 TaxID=1594462 RepID=UPI000C1E3814|nr:restriction endonuclease subunit S [Marinomonas sp. BSi20584]